MTSIRFPAHFPRNRAQVANANDLIESQTTFGQRSADNVARMVGSWHFIIIQSVLLLLWVILNIISFVYHWDPYPFILMNLVLSTQAAFTAPIIMMSQGRQAERDRIEAHNDYQINLKSHEEITLVLEHLAAQNTVLAELQAKLEAIERQLPSST